MLKPSMINKPTKQSAIIPPELMQFVKYNTYSLLIKGYAGTGKTTLSLTILKVIFSIYLLGFLPNKFLFIIRGSVNLLMSPKCPILRKMGITYQVLRMHV